MVSKKILGVAIAAAFSSQAFAALNLSTDAGAVTYAKETILTGDVATAGVNSGLLVTTAAGAELDIVTPIGFGVANNTHAFVRFDLTNAEFKTAVASGDGFTTGDLIGPSATAISNVQVAQGGQPGDAYVILDITGGVDGLAQADSLTLNLAGLAVSTTAPVSITYNHYSTSPAAVTNNGGSLSTQTYANAISVAEALKVTVVATNLVANVSADPAFSVFVTPALATASLGSVEFELAATGAVTPLGIVVNAGNATAGVTGLYAPATSTLTVAGDLSFTTSTSAALTAANLKVGGVASDTAATNVPSGTKTDLTVPAFDAAGLIEITAASAINAGEYSVTVTPAKVAGRLYAPSVKTAALGTITRSGTTIQVPYLSTNPTVNQKLILVNRGATAVPYTISFTKETGVTSVAGTAATGTLAAKETKVIKASDIVTLTSGSRTAATVVITAPETTIDAATQTVITDTTSVSYGSVDTVVLKN